MIDALATADTREHVVFFGAPVFGDDKRDVLADRHLRGPTEHTLGATVPRRNDSIQGLRHDGIIGRIDDRGEQHRGVFLEYGEGLLGGFRPIVDRFAGLIAEGAVAHL